MYLFTLGIYWRFYLELIDLGVALDPTASKYDFLILQYTYMTYNRMC